MKILILAMVATCAVALQVAKKSGSSSSSSSSSSEEGGNNHCDPSPCQNGGTCEDRKVTYSCKCPRGYFGRNCQNKLKAGCDNHPCKNDATCVNKPFWRYYCKCLPGYHGKNCTNTPCDAKPCLNGGTCNNGGAPNGGYNCDCADGYEGPDCGEEVVAIGYNCVDKVPCARENTIQHGFYFAYDQAKNKFVQCSEWEQCFVMPCAVGTEWDQKVHTCGWPK